MHLEGWGDEVRAEVDDIQVVREMRHRPAVSSAAKHARVALAVVTDATEVLPGGISEKDIRAGVELCLRAALEAPPDACERAQVGAIRNRDEDVGVLRSGLGSEQGAEECDTEYTADSARTENELARELEKSGADLDR
jgi:hypothetical protein